MKDSAGSAASSILSNSKSHVSDDTPSDLSSSDPPSPSQPQLLLSQSQPEQTTRSASIQHRRKLATALYLLTTSLLFADQNLLSPNLSAIAAEFQFDDMERDKKLGGVQMLLLYYFRHLTWIIVVESPQSPTLFVYRRHCHCLLHGGSACLFHRWLLGRCHGKTKLIVSSGHFDR